MSVGHDRDVGSRLQQAAATYDGGADFMARDAGERDHRVLAAKRVEVASAEADHADFEHDLLGSLYCVGDGFEGRHTGFLQYDCLHGASCEVTS
jgi:hypothetical protein